MAGSNYEVNIKLDVRKINQQIGNLERRIKKLNEIAMGQRGAGKTVLKTERDKLAVATRTFRREQQITREKQKQSRIETQTTKNINARNVSKSPSKPKGGTTVAAGGGGGVVSGALISGAFPLLFGQGLAGGATGFAGGAIGGLLGGQTGGFAGGLVATAILTQIQQAQEFRTEIDRLNKSIQATGGESSLTAKQVTQFGKSMGMAKEEALAALNSFKQFGATARIALNQVFGSESVFDTLSGLGTNKSILSALPQLSKELSLDQAQLALNVLKTNGARSAELKLLDMVFDKNKAIVKSEEERVNLLDLLNPFRGGIKRRDDGRIRALTVDELKTERGEESVKDFQGKIDKARELLQIQKDFNKELERQAVIKAPVDELNKLLEPLTQVDALGKSIGNSFSESFKGIVKGSMTAQEALKNMFERTADHFLDMAAKILAAQIRSGIFGIFSGMLSGGGGFSVTGGKSLTTSSGTNIGTAGFMPSNPAFRGAKAEGGPVKGGKSYLVGARGPEMFSPGVSGMITPNHALGGSTTVIVNVDASGSSVEGDETQGRELGRVISAAIQSELVQQKRPGGLLA